LVMDLAAGRVTSWLAVWAALFLYFTYRYFRPMLKLKPRSKFLAWCRMRYISNWALMKGGFVGARTFGVVYLESSW